MKLRPWLEALPFAIAVTVIAWKVWQNQLWTASSRPDDENPTAPQSQPDLINANHSIPQSQTWQIVACFLMTVALFPLAVLLVQIVFLFRGGSGVGFPLFGRTFEEVLSRSIRHSPSPILLYGVVSAQSSSFSQSRSAISQPK